MGTLMVVVAVSMVTVLKYLLVSIKAPLRQQVQQNVVRMAGELNESNDSIGC